MTKNEIKAALDLAGVPYKAKANLETLQALYAQLKEAVDIVSAERSASDDFTMSKEELAAQTGRKQGEEYAVTDGKVDTSAPAPATTTGNGLKIEKDREERNGIKRPSIGGKCRSIWDALDAHAESTGDDPTAKDVKEMAAAHGWNPNNASIEYYQWRKFNGIKGRS